MKCFVQATQYAWQAKPEFAIYSLKVDGAVQVCEVDVEFEIPENFSMTAGQLEILNAKKEAIKEQYHLDIASVEDSISKLQCLEMTP
jgi:hypothetical protein